MRNLPLYEDWKSSNDANVQGSSRIAAALGAIGFRKASGSSFGHMEQSIEFPTNAGTMRVLFVQANQNHYRFPWFEVHATGPFRRWNGSSHAKVGGSVRFHLVGLHACEVFLQSLKSGSFEKAVIGLDDDPDAFRSAMGSFGLSAGAPPISESARVDEASKTEAEIERTYPDATAYMVNKRMQHGGQIGFDYGDSPGSLPLIYFPDGKSGYYHPSDLKRVTPEEAAEFYGWDGDVDEGYSPQWKTGHMGAEFVRGSVKFFHFKEDGHMVLTLMNSRYPEDWLLYYWSDGKKISADDAAAVADATLSAIDAGDSSLKGWVRVNDEPRLVARWQSRGGKYSVDLFHRGGPSYDYRGNGASGSLRASSVEDAVRQMEKSAVTSQPGRSGPETKMKRVK